MFAGCEPISLDGYLARLAARRYRLPGAVALAPLVALLRPGLPWQKFLFRKPPDRPPN
jgi:hypothetical protein